MSRAYEAFANLTIPAMPKIDPALFRDHKLADTLYEHLKEQIAEAQKTVKEDEIISLHYWNGPVELLIYNIGYHNPSLLILQGIDAEQNECKVFVSMNAVNLVLKKQKGKNLKKKVRKIGFLGQID